LDISGEIAHEENLVNATWHGFFLLSRPVIVLVRGHLCHLLKMRLALLEQPLR
jgi:hypothetical protein